MIKNYEEVLKCLKDVYNSLGYDYESPYDKDVIRKVLVAAGVQFNTQTGDAI